MKRIRIERTRSTPVDFAKSCPQDAYKFIGNDNYKFGIQNSRVANRKRISSLEDFTSGNFQFVYKNCSQLRKEDELYRQKNPNSKPRETLLSDLNDVLFSHCFWADTGVEWNLLFAAIAHVQEEYCCPICLFQPCCPRLTKCGHIICADCLDQLFHQKTDKLPLCPICNEVLYKDDIVRCKCVYHPNKLTNSNITFAKVFKYISDNICFCSHGELDTLRTASDPLNRFTRFSIADSRFIDQMYKSELEQLEKQKEIYAEYECPEKIVSIDKIIADVKKEMENKVVDDHIKFYIGKHKPNETKVCFYQSNDGQLVFLNEFCRRLLIEQFGSLENAPDIIETTVINSTIERDRLFSHVPHGGECTTVFADLTHILSPEVLERNRLEIKANTPVIRKKKEPKRVITADDFQKFIPEEPEPEVKMSSEADFPSLYQDRPAPKMPKKKTLEEDFPSLSGPKKNDDFPSFDALNQQTKGKKQKQNSRPKPNPWGSLNI